MNPNDIVDLSGVSPQQTFLESHPEKPAADSTLYINHFTTTNNDQSKSHTVAGMHVVLQAGNPNGLWDALHIDRSKQKMDAQHPQTMTHSLLICCDTLEVHGEFCVPEADVAVFARRLIWATADAAINTSPLDWALAKAEDASENKPGQKGAAGRNAGSLSLFISAVKPDGDTRPRLLALGGPGQHPGAGRDGKQGKSMSSWSSVAFEINDSNIATSKATVNFSPPAVYIDYEWLWVAVQVASDKKGADAFPESGTNAQAPGIPGDGGNGGGLTTNLASIVRNFLNTAGKAGNKERDYWGGPAGTPTSCAKYKVKLWHDILGTDNAKNEVTKTDSKTTAKGADAQALDAVHGDGNAPQPGLVSEANAWLHPLGLQKALEYARDLFLAGGRSDVETLLSDYEAALALPTPTQNQAWDDGTAAQWTAAQSEVATMLQRLRSHLDYFGNAAGYTPLLSLTGSFKLYAEETQRALRTLMLVGWIDAKEREAKETASALAEAIGTLNDDTQQAAAQVISAESKINAVTKRIDALEQELADRSRELAELRTHLLSQAENDLQQQARIKFAIKMAAAVCQVIPVGQPALGSIGSLGSVAADFIGGSDETAPDTVSKLGEVMEKARAAAKKAEAAKDKAKKEKEKSEKADDTKSAKDKASGWAKVGDGLGPALSQVSQGLKALQVPASEVDAALQKLESESEEWKALVKKITSLNERKAAFAEELVDALQSLGDGYARISSNTAAVFSMQQERAKAIGKVDPAATGFVRQMGQRSRFSLLKYLYLMVKSYETTVFKAIDVDWKLSEIADKITALLKPEEGFDATTLESHIKVLTPLFEQNLETVRRQLLGDFNFNERSLPLQLGLTGTQTPDVLAELNRAGQVVLDPLVYGLVLSDYQLERLNLVELKRIAFDSKGPPLPDTTNVIISLQPGHTGTMRKAEGLYAVYSDNPLMWSWNYVSGEIHPSKPSEAAQDILDLILGRDAGRIRQKVALPPVWSDFYVKVDYSPELPLQARPRISELYFEMNCDINAAPAHQAVLKVRSLGSAGGAIIKCSPDLAGRADGFEHMIRIYSKGASAHLNVPSHIAGAAFDTWDLTGKRIDRTGIRETELTVPLDDNVLAQCHWHPAQLQEAEVVLAHVSIESANKLTAERAKTGFRAKISPATEPPRDLPIRAEASEQAPILGITPTVEAADLVEPGQNGWLRINYRGVVGWVNT